MKWGRWAAALVLCAQFGAREALADEQKDDKNANLAQQAADAAAKAAEAAGAAAAAAKAAADAAKAMSQPAAPSPTPTLPPAFVGPPGPGQVLAPTSQVPPPSSAEAAAAAAKPPTKPRQYWFGTISLNLISITGNANSLTGSGLVNVERRGDEWIVGLHLDGKYGQARPQPDQPYQIVAEQASVAIRVDRRFTSRFAAYLKTGLDIDHVKSIRDREYGEGGASITWIDNKEGDLQRTLLTTDLALRGAYEDRFQWFPTFMDVPAVTLVAPRFGVTFRYALTKDVIFSDNAEVITNVYGDPRVLVNDFTNIGARLSDALSITVGFEVHYDSAPAVGRVPTDTLLTLGLDLSM